MGFKGISVGLGGGDVLVGPSFAALIVGSSDCGTVGCDSEEHADEPSRVMLHKAQMSIKNRRFSRSICSPLRPSPLSREVQTTPLTSYQSPTVIPLQRECQSEEQGSNPIILTDSLLCKS